MYISVCKKYGPIPYFASMFATIAAPVVQHPLVGIGLAAGLSGAVLFEPIMLSALKARKTRIKRGSRIYRGVQIGFVTAGLLFGARLETKYQKIISAKPTQIRQSQPIRNMTASDTRPTIHVSPLKFIAVKTHSHG